MKTIILISLLCSSIMATYAIPLSSVSKPYVPGGHSEPLEAAASDMLPVEYLTDKFDMFVPMDDNYQAAASMHVQNFENFKEMPNSNDDDDNDMMMEESHLLPRMTPVRPPQALTNREKQIRSQVEYANAEHERRKKNYFRKGSMGPKTGAGVNRWESLDYDSISGHPGEDKRYTRG